jgi:S-adenosylmethionine-diacylglycerol 3-amino-3-carboxypropyl transferase
MVSTFEPALRPEASDIHYGEVREDPELERKVVERLAEELGRPVRVAVIASGGCTALSLLASDAVETVDAIDASFPQVALVVLRRTALIELSLDEQRAFLGYDEAEPAAREALYQRVRPSLPESVADFFDARPQLIRAGVARNGRLELLFKELEETLKAEGIDPAKNPARALGSPAFRAAFKDTFDRGRIEQLFGTQAFAYSKERSFSEHLTLSVADALRRFKVDENEFLARLFHGEGAEPAAYLSEDAQARIKDLGPFRLAVHHGPLLGQLSALSADRPFDLIQCSDITDWLPVPERHALLRGIKASLSEGGALLARRLNGDGMLASIIREHLEVDAALSTELLSQDRSFLYREVVVAYKR